MGEVYSTLEKEVSGALKQLCSKTLDEVKSAMELPILKINDLH